MATKRTTTSKAEADAAPTQDVHSAYQGKGVTKAVQKEVTLVNERIALLRKEGDNIIPDPAPIEQPPFTIKELKEAIPPHCFERSYFKSFMYLGRDILYISLLFLFGMWVSKLSFYGGVFLWPVYWIAQGAVMTGLWVTAHECGHQAFSPSKTVNDIVGLFAHSFLLVPYHPWRISHGKHHSNTGSCENDEVFVPTSKAYTSYEVNPATDMHIPLTTTVRYIAATLLFGWPAYLISNISGPEKYKGKVNDHFRTDSALFSPRNRTDIIVSDLFLAVWISILIVLCNVYSVYAVAMLYFIPYLNVNFWLVLITFLQHSDVYLPHFRGEEWNWLRGALCTVDRSYGWVLDDVFHHIADTHVCHHLFSYMPHYHAQEATEHLKKVLGKYHLKDETPIAKAIYRSMRECQWVDKDANVVFFRPY